MTFSELSTEQQQFCNTALAGYNIRVEACIGSGKTTAIQTLCNMFPQNKLILYLTYNKLLKTDAKSKIKNYNITVTNYHGFVYPYLRRNNIECGLSESIDVFTKNKLTIPRYDILIIDEYQDIELNFAEMLEYVKSTNPNMQIIVVGDISQKIYDKTTLDVASWIQGFLGSHIELEFTKCFRLNADLAAKLGRIWNKNICGVNKNCKVTTMSENEVIKHLSQQTPGNILCLGARTGPMSRVLNILENKHSDKFNKNTVYASIQDGGTSIEPNDETAIFTTFDGSKGMEKPICAIFDWDNAYWNARSKQPDANYEILRNIFCVAASRGKNEIIFVDSIKNGRSSALLTEETLMTPIDPPPLKDAYVSDMFSFKFIEEINKAYQMLNITKIDTIQSDIDIKDSDAYIDLSPCIKEYQKMIFFKGYDIDKEIADTLDEIENRHDIQPNEKSLFKNQKLFDISYLNAEQKLLYLVSLKTRQNRYCNQVTIPFVNIPQYNALIIRLSERLSCDDMIGPQKQKMLKGITIHDKCDVLKNNHTYHLEFKHSLAHEDFLQAAMHMLVFDTDYSLLWNIRTNELYHICIDDNRKNDFLHQVHRIITKEKSSVLPRTYGRSNTIPKLVRNTKQYHPGDKIHHKTFGDGTVTSIKATNDTSIITIDFDNFGTKQILSDYLV